MAQPLPSLLRRSTTSGNFIELGDASDAGVGPMDTFDGFTCAPSRPSLPPFLPPLPPPSSPRAAPAPPLPSPPVPSESLPPPRAAAALFTRETGTGVILGSLSSGFRSSRLIPNFPTRLVNAWLRKLTASRSSCDPDTSSESSTIISRSCRRPSHARRRSISMSCRARSSSATFLVDLSCVISSIFSRSICASRSAISSPISSLRAASSFFESASRDAMALYVPVMRRSSSKISSRSVRRVRKSSRSDLASASARSSNVELASTTLARYTAACPANTTASTKDEIGGEPPARFPPRSPPLPPWLLLGEFGECVNWCRRSLRSAMMSSSSWSVMGARSPPADASSVSAAANSRARSSFASARCFTLLYSSLSATTRW
mmetsp:Transcript_21788/g.53829  ORF Transcript_21788/g.53829 Transcript_21788/m.53829 type:complete len:376 (-) Transcript_21788:359-1486(-)